MIPCENQSRAASRPRGIQNVYERTASPAADARRVLALCWTAYAASYLSRSNMAVSLARIVGENGYPVSAVSVLGTLFFVFYAVGQLVNGRVGDFAPPRAMIFFGMFLSGLCNMLFGWTRAYWALAVAWAVNGYALSALWGPMMRLMAHYYDEARRNAVSTIMMTSSAVGCVASWGLAGPVLARFGYQPLFYGTGALTLLYCLAFLLLLPRADIRPAARAPRKGGIHAGLASLVAILLVCAAMGFIKEGINFYAPYMMERTGAISVSLAVVLPLFSFAGSLLSGLLNRRAGISIAGLVSVLFGACLAALALLYALGRTGTFAAPLILGMLGIASATMYAVTTYLIGFYPMRFYGVNAVSYVAGLLDFFTYIGAGASSVLSGALFDRSGLHSVILVWAVLAALVTAAAFAARAVSGRSASSKAEK